MKKAIGMFMWHQLWSTFPALKVRESSEKTSLDWDPEYVSINKSDYVWYVKTNSRIRSNLCKPEW